MEKTTTPRRMIGRTLVFCVVAALAAGLYLRSRKPAFKLPASAHYPALPEKFSQALHNARQRISSRDTDPEGVRGLAHLYHANRLYPEARACYRFIESTSPGLNAHDYYYLADIAQNEGDLPRAQKELRAVLKTEPHYLPARMALAETLFKSGQEDEAAKEYGAILAQEPNQPQASVGLARIELQRGEDAEAVGQLEKLMAEHPEATSGAALLAQLFNRRGETERAAAMTQWSQQKREPVLPDPWMDTLLADCYDSQRLTLKFEEYLFTGQMDQAYAFLEKVEDLDPQSWTPQMLRGWSQARAKHHAEAVAEFRKALAKGGDPEKICPLLVTSLLAIPDLPEAQKLMAEYQAKLPESVAILTAYAEVALRQGDEKLATVLLGKILEKEPYLYTPNMSLAKILWSTGRHDEAVVCLQRIARVFPIDVASRGLLGQYYLEKALPLKAIEPLEQARAQSAAGSPAEKRLTEMLGLAYLQTGSAEAEKGRLPEAGSFYEKAVLLSPNDLKTHAFLASSWVQLKQFKRAAESLEKMAALDPPNPTIHLSLGDVLYQDGSTDQAVVHWQRALQLAAAGDVELRQALEARLKGEITPETFK